MTGRLEKPRNVSRRYRTTAAGVVAVVLVLLAPHPLTTTVGPGRGRFFRAVLRPPAPNHGLDAAGGRVVHIR
jgi:hypothetical protein